VYAKLGGTGIESVNLFGRIQLILRRTFIPFADHGFDKTGNAM
jgi:hypothetical protein